MTRTRRPGLGLIAQAHHPHHDHALGHRLHDCDGRRVDHGRRGHARHGPGRLLGRLGNPTTANACTGDGSGTGSFTSAITGLTAGAAYHARAYAGV